MVNCTAPERRGSSWASAVVLCAFLLPAQSLANSAVLKPSTGRAPPFALSATDGTAVTLKPLEYAVTIVHFFATWCEPCREELPSLHRLADRADALSVRILAISVAEPDLRVRRFVQAASLSFPVLLDRDGAVTRAWRVFNLPSTVILDRDLRPRLFIEREFNWDGIEASVLVDTITHWDQVGHDDAAGEEG
jgi:thiol-disulfide isomerase/thioredoxin